jgi:uncharacterized membrane protein
VRKLFTIAAFLAFAVYALASLLAPPERPALAVVPLIAALGCVLLAAADRWWPLAALPVAGAIVAAAVWPPAWLIYAPPTLMSFLAASVFITSLRPGREPIVSRIARLAHGGVLEPCFVGYTRNVTLAWGVFLVACGLAALVLAAFAPRSWWWTFCNVGMYVAFVLAFAIEYGIRRRMFPDIEHVSPLRLVGVMRAHGFAPDRRMKRAE